jgi:hypothetical protein
MADHKSLVSPIHIFAYHNKFYFDGSTNLFMADGKFNVGIDETKPVLPLAVFIYEKQKQRKVCEYHWLNNTPHKYQTASGGYYD